MLTIKNLSYNLNNKIIFNNISATFNDGEIIGITGSAGSGKSSFINLLRNSAKDYSGSISINDSNIKTTNKKILKKIISHYSLIENSINPESITKELILSGRIKHKKRLSPYSEMDKEIARRVMINFELEKFAEIRLKMISESSRKMSSIAKTFSAQTDILMLEKPDAGLNINQRVVLSKAIKKYTSTGSRIVILTSTDLNFIAGTCDRIIVLADNSIAESGTHKIITADFVKKYFNIEAVVTRNIYSGLPEIQIIEEN